MFNMELVCSTYFQICSKWYHHIVPCNYIDVFYLRVYDYEGMFTASCISMILCFYICIYIYTYRFYIQMLNDMQWKHRSSRSLESAPTKKVSQNQGIRSVRANTTKLTTPGPIWRVEICECKHIEKQHNHDFLFFGNWLVVQPPSKKRTNYQSSATLSGWKTKQTC